MPKIIIIGGGIAGLSAAHRLIEHSPPNGGASDLSVTVLERDETVGGKAKSRR